MLTDLAERIDELAEVIASHIEHKDSINASEAFHELFTIFMNHSAYTSEHALRKTEQGIRLLGKAVYIADPDYAVNAASAILQKVGQQSAGTIVYALGWAQEAVYREKFLHGNLIQFERYKKAAELERKILAMTA